MGTSIVAKNSNAETAGTRKFIPPVTRGLEAWHFLNTNVQKAATNYAMGKPNASIVGAPAEFPQYIQFKGLTNFLQTNITETATMTTFTVVRSKDTFVDANHAPAFYGNYGSFAFGGAYLAVNPAVQTLSKATVRYTDPEQTVATTGQAALPLTSIVLGEWTIFVDITRTSANELRDVTHGQIAKPSTVFYGRKPSPALYRIGSMYDTASILWKGTADMALFAHYSTELTESEIAAVVARIRAYMSQRQGIIV